jgi:hypothetical protein
MPKYLPKEYNIASYLSEEIPYIGTSFEDSFFAEDELNKFFMDEKFISHFYACLLNIAKKSDDLMPKPRKFHRNLDYSSPPRTNRG